MDGWVRCVYAAVSGWIVVVDAVRIPAPVFFNLFHFSSVQQVIATMDIIALFRTQ